MGILFFRNYTPCLYVREGGDDSPRKYYILFVNISHTFHTNNVRTLCKLSVFFYFGILFYLIKELFDQSFFLFFWHSLASQHFCSHSIQTPGRSVFIQTPGSSVYIQTSGRLVYIQTPGRLVYIQTRQISIYSNFRYSSIYSNSRYISIYSNSRYISKFYLQVYLQTIRT